MWPTLTLQLNYRTFRQNNDFLRQKNIFSPPLISTPSSPFRWPTNRDVYPSTPLLKVNIPPLERLTPVNHHHSSAHRPSRPTDPHPSSFDNCTARLSFFTEMPIISPTDFFAVDGDVTRLGDFLCIFE
ncbi:UNVERIFIED_CONTAM: hypothetical protein Sindi_2834000 [Sesamum indicum]